jgi:hypothetical protein
MGQLRRRPDNEVLDILTDLDLQLIGVASSLINCRLHLDHWLMM